MDFITKLYQNENFPIYLGIIIVILIIVFFIVFMLGKKDEVQSKKIIKDKELEDAFEETTQEMKAEVPLVDTNVLAEKANNNTSYSAIQNENDVAMPTVESKVRMPLPEKIDIDEIARSIENDIREYVLSRPVEGDAPETKPIEPERPFNEEEYTNANDMLTRDIPLESTDAKIEKYKDLASSIEKELSELEQKSISNEPIFSDKEEELLPSFNDSPIKEEIPVTNEDVISEDDLINDTRQIELPKLK